MKAKRRYILSLEDQAYQRTRFSVSFRPLYMWLTAAAALTVLIILAGIVILASPLSKLLPDYLPESQRMASRQAIMRVDSLNNVIVLNNAWISNFQRITDTDRRASDSIEYARDPYEYNPDSLPDASPLERQFVNAMEERERYNISVLAPLDADGMLFVPVAPQAYYDAEAIKATDPTILLPSENPVQAVADGTVLAVFFNTQARGYTILVQHARGFVSSYAHLGSPLVVTGDDVSAGQPLAFPPAPDNRANRWIQLRIWHNGTPLTPYKIVGRE